MVILKYGESKVHSGKIEKSRSRAWTDRRMVVGGWDGESMSGWGNGIDMVGMCVVCGNERCRRLCQRPDEREMVATDI